MTRAALVLGILIAGAGWGVGLSPLGRYWCQLARWRWQHRGCCLTHQRARSHDSLAGLYGWWCVDHQQGLGRMGPWVG